MKNAILIQFLLLTFVAVSYQTYAQQISSDNSQLTTILYYWEGKVNGEKFKGDGTVVADSKTGEFSAIANFDAMPSSFEPSLAGWSIISLSCGNTSKKEGAQNIISLTAGNYQSVSTINYYDEKDNFLGNLEINGRFSIVGPNVFKGEIAVTGTYKGQIDSNYPTGYVLPCKPIDKRTFLGSFTTYISLPDGTRVRAEHSHKYVFLDGVKEDLVASSMDLKYNNGYWSREKGILRFNGISVMRPATTEEISKISYSMN